MTKTFLRAAFASALLATVAAPALASTATGDLGVSANITNNCVVSSSPVAFGNINFTAGVGAQGTGSVSVTCTIDVPWALSAGIGTGSGATVASRKMGNGAGNLLTYVLYTTPGQIAYWGDGTAGTATINGTGTGLAQSNPIWASTSNGNQTLPAGSYSDTVPITVTY